MEQKRSGPKHESFFGAFICICMLGPRKQCAFGGIHPAAPGLTECSAGFGLQVDFFLRLDDYEAFTPKQHLYRLTASPA